MYSCQSHIDWCHASLTLNTRPIHEPAIFYYLETNARIPFCHSPPQLKKLTSETWPILEGKLQRVFASQHQSVRVKMEGQHSRSYENMASTDNGQNEFTLWAERQSAVMRANFSQISCQSVLRSQGGYVQQFQSQDMSFYQNAVVAQMVPSASHNGHVLTSITSPYITLRTRDRGERIQLTVAFNLYMETLPGPLLDDLTMAQIVYNQVYGMAWSPPEEDLLSTLNQNPNAAIRALYRDVVEDRRTWTIRASQAYVFWARLCRSHGIEPPPVFVGRWW